jgi:signal transduction histidine kinase
VNILNRKAYFNEQSGGEALESTNSDAMVESLNQPNEQLLQTIKQLKAENAKLRLFVNIAAHELRTPIMPIIGYSEILQEDIGERKEIKGIIYNAKRLEQLAGNILDGAKIENHALQLHNERFNLKDLLFDIIQDHEDQLLMKGKNNIQLLYQPKDIFLEADKVRLQRVISNLLNNAIKFTTKGNITINTKEIKSEQQMTKVQVSIIDTGSGLSKAVLPKLFSKFVSTDSGGTGLGLFVSMNIIESHGGRIEAQNNSNGKGATFSFIIPDRLC